MTLLSDFRRVVVSGVGRLQGGGRKPATLETILQPSVRDRWTGPSVRSYTPDTVKGILAGAVSGDAIIPPIHRETFWTRTTQKEETGRAVLDSGAPLLQEAT